MRKKISRILIVTLMMLSCSSLGIQAHAREGMGIEQKQEIQEDYIEIDPQRDVTGYIMRHYEGRIERRLWSYTRGIWLSDWEVVG